MYKNTKYTKHKSQSKPIHFYEYGNFNSLCKPLILYFVWKRNISSNFLITSTARTACVKSMDHGRMNYKDTLPYLSTFL